MQTTKKEEADLALAKENEAVKAPMGTGAGAWQNAEKQPAQGVEAAAPAAGQSMAPAPAGKSGAGYDPISDAAYQEALAALTQVEQNAPSYKNSYEGQLEDIYDRIVNRDKFSYDLNGDMLYQQYKDQYIQQGQLAMRDTMGQAAALTGGYGSTYGQAVGQQQYDAYIQQLNGLVPELYGMALDRYRQEGDDLYQLYGLTGDMADEEYARYQDEYNKWLTERDYAQKQADAAYDRGYREWNTGYGIQQENYQNLLYLITASGYNPSDEELAGAGLTRAQADSLRNKYLMDNGLLTVGGSSGGGSGGWYGDGGGGNTSTRGQKIRGGISKQDAKQGSGLVVTHGGGTVDGEGLSYDQFKEQALNTARNLYNASPAKANQALNAYMNSGVISEAEAQRIANSLRNNRNPRK